MNDSSVMRHEIRNNRKAFVKDMISVLEFYQALGFDRVPITLKADPSICTEPPFRAFSATFF